MVAAMLVQRSSIGCIQCNCFPAAATPLSIASRSPLRILCVFVLPSYVCVYTHILIVVISVHTHTNIIFDRMYV